MDIPVTAGEASIVVLTLLILKEVLVKVIPARHDDKENDNHPKPPCMTVEQHDRECNLKLKPIMDGLRELKECSVENRKAIERNRDAVMEELKALPKKLNGGNKT